MASSGEWAPRRFPGRRGPRVARLQGQRLLESRPRGLRLALGPEDLSQQEVGLGGSRGARRSAWPGQRGEASPISRASWAPAGTSWPTGVEVEGGLGTPFIASAYCPWFVGAGPEVVLVGALPRRPGPARRARSMARAMNRAKLTGRSIRSASAPSL